MEGGETGRKLMLEMGMKGRERAQKQGSSQRDSEVMDEDIKKLKKKGFKKEGKETKKGIRSEGRKEGRDGERDEEATIGCSLIQESPHIGFGRFFQIKYSCNPQRICVSFWGRAGKSFVC